MVKVILTHYEDSPLVVLKRNTKIRLEKREETDKGGIFAFFGKLFFKGDGRDHRGFNIVTSNAAFGCEGTEFDLGYDESEKSTTINLYEGRVKIEFHQGPSEPLFVTGGETAGLEGEQMRAFPFFLI